MPTFPLYQSTDHTRPYYNILQAGQGEAASIDQVVVVATLDGDPVPTGEYMLRAGTSGAILPVTVGEESRVVRRGTLRTLAG